MEVNGELAEQRVRSRFEPGEIVPPAVVGQLGVEIAPEALNQVELRRVRWQEERLEAVGVLLPVGA